MYAQDNILCQFGLIICHSPIYSFLHQFSTIFGGNCIKTLYPPLIGFCFIQKVCKLCPLNSLIISSTETQKQEICTVSVIFYLLGQLTEPLLHTIMHLLGDFLHQLHHQKDLLVLLESDECASKSDGSSTPSFIGMGCEMAMLSHLSNSPLLMAIAQHPCTR